MPPPVVMTIAGSDSGGGAGIQADLKTFAAHDTFGTCAITCVTAQTPNVVAGIAPIDPEMVALQIRTVCSAFELRAIKTGMLFSAAIINATADVLLSCGSIPLVIDPVMVATSGARLLEDDAVHALTTRMMPLARVVTPNVPEAEVLAGRPVVDHEAMREAARRIAGQYGIACVVKGGHMRGEGIMDVLCDHDDVIEISGSRVPDAQTHGTGCMYSAALAAGLAHGDSLPDAVERAQSHVRGALAGQRP